MGNRYADIGTLERRITNGQTFDTGDVINALRVLDAASRDIDGECNRHFYAETKTVYLTGSGRYIQEVDFDLISVSALLVDDDGDRVYETTLVEGTDFELANLDNDDDSATPYNAIRLLDDGALSVFPRRKRAIKLTARVGYSAETEAVLTSAGAAVTGTLADATDTTLATSAVASPELAAGMVLRIESEDVEIISGTASPFVVKRGANGTTAAGHTAAAVSRYVYPSDIIEATLIQAGRLFQRVKNPQLPSIIMAPGLGDMQLQVGLDIDVRNSVARLKRYTTH